ncbi:MAG: cytochrome bc complex cytochrome b subunit [Capsulimonadaceae bacterium]|nr:cytochrome bc complex cytochrome b subunit [Capsulimonadaceae bacterium]
MDKIRAYLDERLGLEGLLEFMSHKKVPIHRHSFWYYWGGITLICFIVQILTGILLLVYYRPGQGAYESVRSITYDINFGWLIRSAHNWSASLFLFSAFTHMFSVYFMKAYRAPRELGWWSGMILLALGMLFGFSGYLLPMDDLAASATKVGMAMLDILPKVGPWAADLMRGGVTVGDPTVQRFFALHVVVLPMIFMPLLGFHLWLVQKHGNAVPPSEYDTPVEERKSVPFFPNFMIKDLAMWLIALNVIAMLASLFPFQLGEQADPLKPAPPGIHPEWYFMSAFQVLKIVGKIIPGTPGEVVGMGGFTLGLILWVLIPLYDGKTESGVKARNAHYFGLLALGVLIITTIWGYAAL